MPNALAKLDDLKAALGFSGTAEDALLTTLLEAATATAARLVGVPSLMREADLIEHPRARWGDHSSLIDLDRYPVESITQIKLAGYTADSDGFAEIDPLGTDTYELDPQFGTLELFYGERFAPHPRSNQVIYTAGYVDPSDVAPPAAGIQPPLDLQQGIGIEATRLYNTRRDAGRAEVDAGQGDTHSVGDREVHPALVEACRALRRVRV